MEFLSRNLIDASVSYSVESNTTAAESVTNWDLRDQYITSGFSDDNTISTFTVNFGATVTIDRIAILEHNLQEFSLFYDNTTTNQINLTSTAATTVAEFAFNSDTSNFFIAQQFNCTSLSFRLQDTIVTDTEKAIGVFYAGAVLSSFDRIPSAKNYKPSIIPKQMIHRMSDGGTRIHKVSDKWKTDLTFTDIDKTFRDELKTIYDRNDSAVFQAFGTTTAWEPVIFDANWENAFEFYRFAENSTNAGYKGKIKLTERTQ